MLVEAVEATLEKDVELVEANVLKVIHQRPRDFLPLPHYSVYLPPAYTGTTHSTDCSRLKVVERPVSIWYLTKAIKLILSNLKMSEMETRRTTFIATSS
jgi:hypothetical protein